MKKASVLSFLLGLAVLSSPSFSVAAVSFPANGQYSLPGKAGTVNIDFSYSNPVPVANFFAWESRTFDAKLGNFGKGLFGAPMVAPGPAFRWDVSNPLSIKGPTVVEMTHGPSGGSGPIFNGGWAHLDKYNGSVAVESPDGDARFVDRLGMSQTAGMVWDGASGSGSFGASAFACGGGMNDGTCSAIGAGAVSIYSSADKYFVYTKSRTGIAIYDVSDMEESALTTSVGTLSWNVSEMSTVRVPGKGDFLLGLGPSVRVAKINPDTGKAAAQRSYSVGGGKNLQSVAYNGKIYVFIGESISSSVFDPTDYMTIGIYELNPDSWAWKKINTLTIKPAVPANTAYYSNSYQFVGSPDGDVRPVLIVPTARVFDVWDQNADLRFYKTDRLFSEPASTFGPQDAELVIPKTPWPTTFQGGELIISQVPFNALLKSEGNKVYLNLFRRAHLLSGIYSGIDAPFGVYGKITSFDDPIWGSQLEDGGTGYRFGRDIYMAGPAAIRADRIDASSLFGISGAGGDSSVPDTSTPPGGGGGGPVLPPPQTGNECVDKYRTFCDQVQRLKRDICRLIPDSTFCQ